MAEAQQQSPQPGGKTSLKLGEHRCPLQGSVNAILKPKDGQEVTIAINIKLKSAKGTYTATADKGTAVFDEVVPDTYRARVEVADDIDYVSSGPPKDVTVQKQQTATVELPIRKKPWVGWKLLNLADKEPKPLSNVKFKVAIPPKVEGDKPEEVEKRPSGDQEVAKVEKLRGEHIELLSVETDQVLIFDSVESA